MNSWEKDYVISKNTYIIPIFSTFYLYPTFLYIFPYVYEKCIGFRCFALASQVKWEIYEFIE